jgi:hypothetical protein
MAIASLQTPVFTNGYAYRNRWPRSIILQYGDPYLGQFGKLQKASPCLSAHPHGTNLFPLEGSSLSLDYMLDDLGFDSWKKQVFFFYFSKPPDRLLGTPSLLFKGYRELLPRKATGG